EDDDGGRIIMVAAAVKLPEWRVAASKWVDRIDPVTRRNVEARRKNPAGKVFRRRRGADGGRRWLSSEITQSPSGSSDTSERSENSGSFKDSGRSDEEDSKDRAWYKRCAMNHCCYLKKVDSSSIILMLYVDDILVAGFDMAEIKKLKRKLSQEFEMKDLGPAKQILGVGIIRDRMKGTLRLSQEKYIGKVLEKINMKDVDIRYQPLGDQFKLIGSVMYAMVCTRLDIAYAVGVVSIFISNPGREHWEVVKWLLRYLKGTSKATLCFSRKEVVLEGFSNLDYGSCLDSGKGTTGYVFIVGGIAVSLMSRIQKYVAMSTTEAEYMAIVEAGKELSAIHLVKNLVFHGQTKHIKIRYHYIRELVSEGMLSLKKILGAKNLVDMLTTVVKTKKLKLYATLTGLQDN
ncbi:retrovirus-related pol polyprotein from transposon TNT 1-94, partial [Tanacetum coccineum]